MSAPADGGGPQHLRQPPPGRDDGAVGGPPRRSRPSRRARLTATISVFVVLVLVAVLLVVTLGGSGGGKPHGAGTTSTTTATTRTTVASAPNPSDTHTFLGPDGVEASWIIAENKLPGTDSWRITGQAASGSIDGFSNHAYAAAGGKVTLYVDSTAPTFRVFAYRMGYYGGTGARLVWTSPSEAGHSQPTCPVTPVTNMVACDNWKPSLTFTVTSAFVPGDYLLKLVGSGNQQYYILLVVWDPTSHAAYVVKNDLFTEEAWNTYGGYDYYQGLGNCAPTYPVCNRARVVSFDRPMFGNGASDFLANEFPLVAWAEQHGLDVTYADDLTLAQHPDFLLQHKVLLSLGHDECWALPERNAALSAADHGMNIVFFGASAMLRHVRLQNSPLGADRELVDYRDSSEDPLNGHGNPLQVTGNAWYSPPTDWPESGFVGEMYAGFIEPGDPSAPFVVHDANSWIFKGTGLHDGSALPGVIQADFDHVTPSWPMPSNVEVLGHSPIPAATTQTDEGTWGGDTYSDMTYYTMAASKAGILDTGDNNWIYSMNPCGKRHPTCSSPIVEKITGNLFWLFGQGPAGSIIPSKANWQQVTPSGS